MKISIVIPSYNQGKFLQETLDSLFIQNYPELEVLVFDGGSTDESVDILKNYPQEIHWTSRKDGGQADAINQGMRIATGNVIAYLNSDDIYYPNTLHTVANYFKNTPDCLILYGEGKHMTEEGNAYESYPTKNWDYDRLLDNCFICQPTVFWKREIIEKYGYFDDTIYSALDYEYWLRIGKHTPLHRIKNQFFAGSRMYAENKTMSTRLRSHEEFLLVTLRHGKRFPYRWLRVVADIKAREDGFSPEKSTPDYFAQWVENIHLYSKKYDIPLSSELLGEINHVLTLR